MVLREQIQAHFVVAMILRGKQVPLHVYHAYGTLLIISRQSIM